MRMVDTIFSYFPIFPAVCTCCCISFFAVDMSSISMGKTS